MYILLFLLYFSIIWKLSSRTYLLDDPEILAVTITDTDTNNSIQKHVIKTIKSNYLCDFFSKANKYIENMKQISFYWLLN